MLVQAFVLTIVKTDFSFFSFSLLSSLLFTNFRDTQEAEILSNYIKRHGFSVLRMSPGGRIVSQSVSHTRRTAQIQCVTSVPVSQQVVVKTEKKDFCIWQKFFLVVLDSTNTLKAKTNYFELFLIGGIAFEKNQCKG